MMIRKSLFPVIFLFTVLTGLAISPIARADAHAMMELINVLEQNGTIDSKTAAALRKTATAQKKEHKSSSDASVSLKGGKLKVTSNDGDFEFKLNGRLMLDYAFYNEDVEKAGQRFGNGAELRRARVALGGKVFKYWKYKLGLRFASGDQHINDAYLQWTGFDNMTITAGRHKPPFSLQQQTSSKYISFMERSLVDEFAPGRAWGLSAQYAHDFWRARVGFFTGNKNDGDDIDSRSNPDWQIGARINIIPPIGDEQLVHFGGSINYRKLQASDRVRFRSRPESHVTDNRTVNTGRFAAENVLRYGFEAAFMYGPFAAVGEYMGAMVNIEEDNDDMTDDPNFSGYYVQAMYLLNGKRKYSRSSAKFGGVTPTAGINEGGHGAIEFAARYSTLDLTDEHIEGGEQRNVSLGLNWYPAKTIAFKLDYTQVLEVDGGTFDGNEPGIFQMRAQYEF